MGRPFIEIRYARKKHTCALCQGEISQHECYERIVDVVSRKGQTRWCVRKEHYGLQCLDHPWMRERAKPPKVRVVTATTLEARVVAKVALNGSTIFETEMVPVTVLVQEEDIPF